MTKPDKYKTMLLDYPLLSIYEIGHKTAFDDEIPVCLKIHGK